MVIRLKYLVKIGKILPSESNFNMSVVSCPITFNFNFNSTLAANAQNLYQA
jgi:hypothetical protein